LKKKPPFKTEGGGEKKKKGKKQGRGLTDEDQPSNPL